MILESKYRIHTTNEFFRAYKQVSKYGDLLGCKVVCTASLDGLWVFPRVDNVFNEFIHFNWDQTMSDSSFEEIKGLIGTATNLHLHT